MRTFMYVISVAILLWLVCACAEDGESSSWEVPAGCEGTLIFQEADIGCAQTDARCELLRKNADVPVNWSVRLRLSDLDSPDLRLSDDEISSRKLCLGGLLESRGVQVELAEGVALYLRTATYAQVEPIFRLGLVVQDIAPDCPSPAPLLCDCQRIGVDFCEENPFCGVLAAQIAYREYRCRTEGWVPVECRNPENLTGGDDARYAADTDGNCWKFHNYINLPPQIDWADEDSELCGWEFSQGELPVCSDADGLPTWNSTTGIGVQPEN